MPTRPKSSAPSELPEVLAQGRHLKLVKRGRWEYADRCVATGAVVIVAVTPEDKLILTEQFRIPVGQRVIELPAGLVGDIPGQADEKWVTAARRELLEETGYHARWVKRLGGGPISPGFGTEFVDFFLATGLKRIHAGGGVDGEDIQVHEVPRSRIGPWLKRQARAGLLVDPKVYAGLYFLPK